MRRSGCRTEIVSPSRRGTILIAGMVCLLILSLAMASIIRIAWTERQLALRETQRVQAEWLAESAAERATAARELNPDYEGETWEITADDLGGRDAGRAVISFPVAERENAAARLRVQVDFPSEGPLRTRITKEWSLAAP